jgi:hypothetical protein
MCRWRVERAEGVHGRVTGSRRVLDCWIYGAMSVLAATFVYLYVPETKRRWELHARIATKASADVAQIVSVPTIPLRYFRDARSWTTDYQSLVSIRGLPIFSSGACFSAHLAGLCRMRLISR